MAVRVFGDEEQASGKQVKFVKRTTLLAIALTLVASQAFAAAPLSSF